MSENETLHQLTLFVGDFLVSPSLMQVSSKHRMTIAGSGPSSGESYASYDPHTSCWKTSQASLDGGLQVYSETLPRSGTMRNGKLYPLQPLVPRTLGRESLLWPTLTKSDGAMRLRFSIEALTKRHYNQTPGGGQCILNEEMAAFFDLSPTPTFCEWMMGFPLNWTCSE